MNYQFYIQNQQVMSPVAMEVTTKDIYRSKYGDATKLTIADYHAWSKAVTFILRAAQSWRIVTREEQSPDEPGASSTAKVLERYEEKLEKYNTYFDTAAAIIYQSCTPPIRAYIGVDMNPETM